MLIVEFDGPPSWSLDASETGESTKCPWLVAVRLKAWGEGAEKIGQENHFIKIQQRFCLGKTTCSKKGKESQCCFCSRVSRIYPRKARDRSGSQCISNFLYRMLIVCSFIVLVCNQDGTEMCMKEVPTGESIYSVLTILDLLTVSSTVFVLFCLVFCLFS